MSKEIVAVSCESMSNKNSTACGATNPAKMFPIILNKCDK